MAILFSNLSSEIPKQGTYGPKFKEFYFCTKHFNKTNSRTLISIMTILFQSCCQKHPNKALLVLDLKIFYFCMKLCFQKKEGDFRFDNIFFKFQPKKSSNQPFLFQFTHYSCTKFCNYTNSRVLISNMTILFSHSSPKTPKSGIFGTKFKDFYFCTKLCD